MPKIDLNRIGVIRCPTCYKVSYTSIQDARLAAKTLTDVSTNKYNAYLCSCGYYHIGHLSMKDNHEDQQWWEDYKRNKYNYYRI